MQEATSVITAAAKGIGEKIAEFWEISVGRAYEILGKDNPYPKFRRVVRAIAAVTKGEDRRRRLKLIKADLDVFFIELLADGANTEVETCVLCDELYDVMRTKMAGLSRSERLKECRKAVSILQQEISHLEKEVSE